jgi:hypothetical protein
MRTEAVGGRGHSDTEWRALTRSVRLGWLSAVQCWRAFQDDARYVRAKVLLLGLLLLLAAWLEAGVEVVR